MAHSEEVPTLLAKEIGLRLEQLGMSRRELCRRVKLSRQTLHHLEHDSDRGFAMSTFKAIDEGLRWPPGTAEAYFRGVENAKDEKGGWSTETRVENYLTTILTHLASMNVDELEREVLMLEEESYGRAFTSDDDALAAIKETVQRLSIAMGNGDRLRGAIGE